MLRLIDEMLLLYQCLQGLHGNLDDNDTKKVTSKGVVILFVKAESAFWN